MKYGVLFLILGGVLIVQAGLIGGVYWTLVWPGLGFAVVATAHFGLGPRVFGKRPDGTMAWYAVALLLPYLLLTWLIWHVVRLISSEECFNKVVPGLYAGRRPLANEVPDDVSLVVDLTSEFAEVEAVRTTRHYLALPILDAGVPSQTAFEQLVRHVADWQGPVYVHCAQGHGRTGLVAAAVLIAKGHAATAEEAISILTKARPRLRLGENQLAFLSRSVLGASSRRSHSPRPSKYSIATRAIVIWLIVIFGEILHGIARAVFLVPQVGEFTSNQIGVFTGSIIILVIALAFVRWIGATQTTELLAVGVLWLVLTLGFEIGFGRFVFGASWERLAADYNVLAGGLLPLGMVVLLLAPLIAGKLRESVSTR